MTQTRRTSTNHKSRTGGNRSNSGNRSSSRRTGAYIYDNTARNLDIQRELDEKPRKRLSSEARKNRDKAHHMSFGYVAFLAAALCACAYILINYIQLQSELTSKIKNVAKLESSLNMMKMDNDETYNRITSSIDLEEIKRVAIGELGMTYAKEGQIIMYSSGGYDYMRKVDDE